MKKLLGSALTALVVLGSASAGAESALTTQTIGGVPYLALSINGFRMLGWEQLNASGLNVPGIKLSNPGDSYLWAIPQNGYQGSANFIGYSFGLEANKLAEVNMYASRGTPDAPAPAQAGDELTAFSGGTWRGPNLGFWIPTGEWEFRAEDNINETQAGTNASLWLTQKGTNNRLINFFADGSGNWLLSPPYGTPYYNLGLLGQGVLWGATAVEPSSGTVGRAGLYVKNGEWWQVKSDGTKAALGGSVSVAATFRANTTVDETVAYNALVGVSFNTASLNQGSYYSTATSRWTPRAGNVSLMAAANVNLGVSAGDTCQIYIYKNGVQLFGKVDFAAAAQCQPLVQGQDVANGTDYYEVKVYLGSSTATNKTIDSTAAVTYFSGTVQ